jgi:hypothetical protein
MAGVLAALRRTRWGERPRRAQSSAGALQQPLQLAGAGMPAGMLSN